MNSPICIFGIGSPFGDDQIGWRAIDMLKNKPIIKELIPHLLYLENCDRPGLSLLNKFNNVKIAILIDAIKTGSPLGSIHLFFNEDIFQAKQPLSSHGMGIADALNLGKTLGILPEVLVLYGIEIGEIQLTTEISNVLETALKKLVKILTEIKWQELRHNYHKPYIPRIFMNFLKLITKQRHCEP